MKVNESGFFQEPCSQFIALFVIDFLRLLTPKKDKKFATWFCRVAG